GIVRSKSYGLPSISNRRPSAAIPRIRQHEHPPRPLRRDRLRPVERVDDGWLPPEELRVCPAELLERLLPAHPFVDQQQVRPRDRLVVESTRPMPCGEALERLRELPDRSQKRLLAEIDPGQAHVIGVMKLLHLAALECAGERDIRRVHLRAFRFSALLSISLCEAVASRSR